MPLTIMGCDMGLVYLLGLCIGRLRQVGPSAQTADDEIIMRGRSRNAHLSVNTVMPHDFPYVTP